MSNKDVESSVALSAFGWEPLKAERKNSKAKLMFKLLDNIRPKSLSDLFNYKNELTDYELRDVLNSLCLPQPRTNNPCMMGQLLSAGLLVSFSCYSLF